MVYLEPSELSSGQCYRRLLEGNFHPPFPQCVSPPKCAKPIYVLLPLLKQTSADGMLITTKCNEMRSAQAKIVFGRGSAPESSRRSPRLCSRLFQFPSTLTVSCGSAPTESRPPASPPSSLHFPSNGLGLDKTLLVAANVLFLLNEISKLKQM